MSIGAEGLQGSAKVGHLPRGKGDSNIISRAEWWLQSGEKSQAHDSYQRVFSPSIGLQPTALCPQPQETAGASGIGQEFTYTLL